MYSSSMRLPGDFFADFSDLQRHVEDVFGTTRLPSSIRAVRRGAFPAINMGTTDDVVEVYALAPGIDPAKLDLTVDKGLLTIAGERRSNVPQENDHLNVYARERFNGTFKRVVSLPEDVDAEKVNATYRNGVLRVIIPKRESSRPRRIEVKSVN